MLDIPISRPEGCSILVFGCGFVGALNSSCIDEAMLVYDSSTEKMKTFDTISSLEAKLCNMKDEHKSLEQQLHTVKANLRLREELQLDIPISRPEGCSILVFGCGFVGALNSSCIDEAMLVFS
jgi:threonine dehydrogenase-like Zn-dependent dehydrogenase